MHVRRGKTKSGGLRQIAAGFCGRHGQEFLESLLKGLLGQFVHALEKVFYFFQAKNLRLIGIHGLVVTCGNNITLHRRVNTFSGTARALKWAEQYF